MKTQGLRTSRVYTSWRKQTGLWPIFWEGNDILSFAAVLVSPACRTELLPITKPLHRTWGRGGHMPACPTSAARNALMLRCPGMPTTFLPPCEQTLIGDPDSQTNLPGLSRSSPGGFYSKWASDRKGRSAWLSWKRTNCWGSPSEPSSPIPPDLQLKKPVRATSWRYAGRRDEAEGQAKPTCLHRAAGTRAAKQPGSALVLGTSTPAVWCIGFSQPFLPVLFLLCEGHHWS